MFHVIVLKRRNPRHAVNATRKVILLVTAQIPPQVMALLAAATVAAVAKNVTSWVTARLVVSLPIGVLSPFICRCGQVGHIARSVKIIRM